MIINNLVKLHNACKDLRYLRCVDKIAINKQIIKVVENLSATDVLINKIMILKTI